jgi:CheY-like chemotaxis protein
MPVDIGGKLVRVWSFRDITDITRAQDALIAARDSADRANRQKSEFLANMSHEIRTPMNGVLGMIQLVQAGNLTKEQHQQLEMAYRSGEGLLAILNNILDVSKVEAGRLELHRVNFNLHELMLQLIELMNVGCQEKGLALQLRIDPDVPMHVLGDDVRLRQVLGNLIGNAVKFTSKGSIIVALSVESAGIGFSVQDTGIGIAPDQHDGIFEAFMQADGSITRRFGGTGLGLSISSQLVRLMGGTILLHSEPGRGSAFSFTLDLPIATGGPTPSETRRHPVSRRLNVLLVEDNPVNQLVATGMLKWAGHSVATAENGIEAVQRVTNESFDLVLMDMQMPEMDGPEAARRIRQHEAAQGRRRVPIVALTASAFEADRETCRLAGMDDFLSKPLHRDSLVQAIDRALKDTRVSR